MTYAQALNKQKFRGREVVKIQRTTEYYILTCRDGDTCELDLDWVPPHGFLIEVLPIELFFPEPPPAGE